MRHHSHFLPKEAVMVTVTCALRGRLLARGVSRFKCPRRISCGGGVRPHTDGYETSSKEQLKRAAVRRSEFGAHWVLGSPRQSATWLQVVAAGAGRVFLPVALPRRVPSALSAMVNWVYVELKKLSQVVYYISRKPEQNRGECPSAYK